VAAFRFLHNVGANPIVTTSSNNLRSFLSFPGRRSNSPKLDLCLLQNIRFTKSNEKGAE